MPDQPVYRLALEPERSLLEEACPGWEANTEAPLVLLVSPSIQEGENSPPPLIRLRRLLKRLLRSYGLRLRRWGEVGAREGDQAILLSLEEEEGEPS